MSVEIKSYAREPAIFVKDEFYGKELVIYKCSPEGSFPGKFNLSYSSGGLSFSFYVSKETLIKLGEYIEELDEYVEECRADAKKEKNT
jgi:hypothetical protein